MSEEIKVLKEPILENQLILPNQPYHNDFLGVMVKVFRYSCWFGVMGSRRIIWRLWSICFLCLLVFVEYHAVWKVIKALAGWAIDTVGHRSVTARFGGTLFYTISILSLITCSRLCLSWPDLSGHWAFVERSMAVAAPPDLKLKRRMMAVIWFMISFSILEHVMSILSLVGLDCPPELIMKRYTLLSHGFMILRHEYAEWMAFPMCFINTLATALWNFLDLLLVLISMGLSSRYHRLNQCVAKVCSLEKKNSKWEAQGYKTLLTDTGLDNTGYFRFYYTLRAGIAYAFDRYDAFKHYVSTPRKTADNFKQTKNLKKESVKVYTWRKIREAYVKQATLVRRMDKALGTLILISSFCNFYFICLQLFLGITQGKYISNLRRAYFIISLGWLCARVCSVVLAASDIHLRSKEALKYIYNCDARNYNVEIERLRNQLTKDYVALSGMGFFYLTRTIILQMAGAIITYELVLIQFDDGSYTDSPITINDIPITDNYTSITANNTETY